MKEKILSILDKLWIIYENYEHNPVFTCDQAKWVDVPWKRVKSLFLRNKKPDKFYMVILEDYKQLDLNNLKNILNESKLSFASQERMLEKIWVEPWHVSPFALINNLEKDINIIFDIELKSTLVWFHPWRNDNTTVLNITDVEKYLKYLEFDFKYLAL